MVNYERTHLDCVVISPPEVGGEQLIVLVQPVEVVGQLLRGVEVPHVDVGVRRGYPGHVGAVHHYGDHVVGKDFEEFLRHVVLALYLRLCHGGHRRYFT